eukprot:TRINITY_DN20551_c0_g1_i1.p1 TRINITY_DN20551_c0_g1~~TRINITY_DN20551_c0_g1_i1.p1  ORF type:complete len:355 (+),score=55.43 TRINITY_DN20551_c0_g1_i1:48-1112(+)
MNNNNVKIECSWEPDGDLGSCAKYYGENEEAPNWPAAGVALSKSASGPKRCELRLLFNEGLKIRTIELLSSARIVEVYGTSSSGQEEYWQSNRAKEPNAPGMWHCVVSCEKESSSISMKLFSLSAPATVCHIRGIRVHYAVCSRSQQPSQKHPPQQYHQPQGSSFEDMLSLATRVMPQAADIKKYCDVKFLVLESKMASMESLLPQVDWLVKEIKDLRQEVTELKREKREQGEQIKQLLKANAPPQCPSQKYAAARDERKRERRRSCPNDLTDVETKLNQLRKHKSLTRSSSTPSSASLDRARRFFGFPSNSALQVWMRSTKTPPTVITDSPPDAAIRTPRRSRSFVRELSLDL